MLHASDYKIPEFDKLEEKSSGEIENFFQKEKFREIIHENRRAEDPRFENIYDPKKKNLDDAIKEIDNILKPSGQSVDSIIKSNEGKIKSPSDILYSLYLDLIEEHKSIMISNVFNFQKDKLKYCQNYLNMKHEIEEQKKTIKKMEETNIYLNNSLDSFETDAEIKATKLYEEKNELKKEIEKLTEYKRKFNRLDSCFLQQIKSLSQTYPSFFKNYEYHSLVNSRGEYVCNKDIWIELLKDSSLFSDLLQKEQEIKNLQKEMYMTAMYIMINSESLLRLQSKLKGYGLSDQASTEISDNLFKSFTIEEEFDRYTNLRNLIQEKKENINSIILETLNHKVLPGITNQGRECGCEINADFLKSFLYCSIDGKNINSGDTLLKWIINPLGEKIQESGQVISDAYNYIFTSLCPNLDVPDTHFPEEEKLGNILNKFIHNENSKGRINLDEILTAFTESEVNKLCKLKEKDRPEEESLSQKDKEKILDQILNCQLISRISLYNLQIAAITACNIWKENISQFYEIWTQNTPNAESIFMTSKMNPETEEIYQRITKNIDQLQYFKANEVIQKITDEVILEITNQLVSNGASSIFELLSNQNGGLGQNKKIKQNIIKLLDTEINKLTTEMDRLRNQKEENDQKNIFYYSYSNLHALEENCVFSWLLDKVVDLKAIPENLAIF